MEVEEVVCLEEHVGELGEGEAVAVSTEAGLDAIALKHGVDGEVFTGVSEEVEEG